MQVGNPIAPYTKEHRAILDAAVKRHQQVKELLPKCIDCLPDVSEAQSIHAEQEKRLRAYRDHFFPVTGDT